MARRGHNEEAILRVLREAESGETVVEICRKHGISQQTFLRVEEEVCRPGSERAARASSAARGEREAEAAGGGPFAGPARPAGDRRKKALRPRAPRELAEWAQQAHQFSQRHVAGLIPVHRATLRYQHHRDPQEALRVRLRELAGSRVRYGYRRLTVLLKREGWEVNAKRIYRLYTEEGLIVRTQKRRERAQRQRVASGQAIGANQKWSMDFVAQRLADGRWVRVLTVIDQFTRECLLLYADTALSGGKVALALHAVVASRGAPQSITVDNGTEFASRAMDLWAYQNGVHLDFIRPGRPVENGYIESFNGRLRDECLNVEVFFTLADARRKLALWHHDYNHNRPHSALADRTPAEFAAISSGGKDGDRTALENAARFPLSRRTTTTGAMNRKETYSGLLLETVT
jgi:putative transposase